MSSAITTRLFLLDSDPQPLVGEVIGVDATATTYVINCAPGTDSNDCGTYNNTYTLGPWASETLPPGAKETGNFDLFITVSDPSDPWEFSMHCEMSRTSAQECTTINNGGNDDGSPTATFSAVSDLGYELFGYAAVTITAGQELLAAATSGSQPSKTDATGTGPSGTSSNSAASATETNSSAKRSMSLFTAVSALGVAMLMAFA